MKAAPAALFAMALAACTGQAGGPLGQGGRQAVIAAGCGACHVIPGLPSARGAVGPPLTGIGGRVYIAGILPNSPANMVRWIRQPQSILPGNAMPDTGLDATQAGEIATYLESLK